MRQVAQLANCMLLWRNGTDSLVCKRRPVSSESVGRDRNAWCKIVERTQKLVYEQAPWRVIGCKKVGGEAGEGKGNEPEPSMV